METRPAEALDHGDDPTVVRARSLAMPSTAKSSTPLGDSKSPASMAIGPAVSITLAS
jgi:hypothetical protein